MWSRPAQLGAREASRPASVEPEELDLAWLQENLKRLLAYSSIAHMGYLLVAFQAGGAGAAEAVVFYLTAYFITMLGAFDVVTLMSTGEREADRLQDYRGLFWRRPGLALILHCCASFVGRNPADCRLCRKVLHPASGTSSGLWVLLLVLVLSTVLGLFCNLRVVVTLFAELADSAEGSPAPLPSLRQVSGCILVVPSILVIGL